MIEIVPAIIPESLSDFSAKLLRVKGLAQFVQIDLTDGMFVLSRSWPLRAGDKSSFEPLVRGHEKLPYSDAFQFELDIMAHHPEKILSSWIKLGVARAVFHLESRHDFSEIKRIANDTIELGIALALDPPYERLASYIHDVDYVQVMGIGKLGVQGQPFDNRAVELVRRIKHDFPHVTIQVDGGVDASDAEPLVAAGATRLVAGSSIFASDNPAEAIENIKRNAEKPH
jgi:ribulose-phosphate 3-epimerase